MKIIYVKWFDASYNDKHQSIEEMDENYTLETVGIFVKETDKFITLSTEYVEKSDTYRHNHHIPKVNIIKKKIVKI